MQFLWKYIDDLMGKGISMLVITELLFYVSAGLIPLALPLAILLSSIMTFGNLAENNELTALKSSGLSLYRIIRPLAVAVFVIAIGAFYFANYVIPVANMKWHTMIVDIQNTKISSFITPGVYSQELENYAIKVDEGKNGHFKGILIHDHTTPSQIKTVRAKEGRLYKSENGKYALFELIDGFVVEELAPQAPNFTPDGKPYGAQSNHPSRRTSFDKATYKMDLTGFTLSHSNEDLFKDKHEMLNVFQINNAIDSIQGHGSTIIKNFLTNIKQDHPYLQSKEFAKNAQNLEQLSENIEIPDSLFSFDKMSKADKIRLINLTQTKIRNKNRNIESQRQFMEAMEQDMDQYLIEFHKKLALTVSIVILFFIGAPLGAIVRKGGFGAPVVIAALLFMMYFVLITIGDSLAENGTVSPFIGMWFATFVLTPIAVFLMRAAANDSPIFSKDTWGKLIRFKR